MLPRPPSSTLFPYTTLFRSSLSEQLTLHEEFETALAATACDGLKQARSGHVDGKDRKSTRLNSSHMSISYAVFCLKKKHSGSTGAQSTISPPQCSRQAGYKQ